MSKVLVLYYSSYGHIEKLADAVAAGARETGATVDIKRVPEAAPEAVAKAAHFKLDQSAPIAMIEDLTNYHAIIVAGLLGSAGCPRSWRPFSTRVAGSGREAR